MKRFQIIYCLFISSFIWASQDNSDVFNVMKTSQYKVLSSQWKNAFEQLSKLPSENLLFKDQSCRVNQNIPGVVRAHIHQAYIAKKSLESYKHEMHVSDQINLQNTIHFHELHAVLAYRGYIQFLQQNITYFSEQSKKLIEEFSVSNNSFLKTSSIASSILLQNGLQKKSSISDSTGHTTHPSELSSLTSSLKSNSEECIGSSTGSITDDISICADSVISQTLQMKFRLEKAQKMRVASEEKYALQVSKQEKIELVKNIQDVSSSIVDLGIGNGVSKINKLAQKKLKEKEKEDQIRRKEEKQAQEKLQVLQEKQRRAFQSLRNKAHRVLEEQERKIQEEELKKEQKCKEFIRKEEIRIRVEQARKLQELEQQRLQAKKDAEQEFLHNLVLAKELEPQNIDEQMQNQQKQHNSIVKKKKIVLPSIQVILSEEEKQQLLERELQNRVLEEKRQQVLLNVVRARQQQDLAEAVYNGFVQIINTGKSLVDAQGKIIEQVEDDIFNVIKDSLQTQGILVVDFIKIGIIRQASQGVESGFLTVLPYCLQYNKDQLQEIFIEPTMEKWVQQFRASNIKHGVGLTEQQIQYCVTLYRMIFAEYLELKYKIYEKNKTLLNS